MRIAYYYGLFNDYYRLELIGRCLELVAFLVPENQIIGECILTSRLIITSYSVHCYCFTPVSSKKKDFSGRTVRWLIPGLTIIVNLYN